MSGLRICCFCVSIPSRRHCYASVHKSLIANQCLGSISRLLLPAASYLNSASRLPISVSIPLKKRNFSSRAIAPAVDSPLPGVDEDALVGYLMGKKKATEVAHLVWRRVVQPGDTVVDATCGNGHDTLEMVKMVADESGKGSVYGLDIQKDALDTTSSLLDETLTPKERELVKLDGICHSRMEEIVPENSPVR